MPFCLSSIIMIGGHRNKCFFKQTLLRRRVFNGGQNIDEKALGHTAHRAKRPLEAPAPIYFLLVVTRFRSLCSLRLLTLSPSLSMTPCEYQMLSHPGTMPIYLNKLSIDGSLRAVSSVSFPNLNTDCSQ